MSDFLHLLTSDWRRITKTPSVLLLWLAFPLLLSLIEYAAFGQLSKSSTGLPKGLLLLVDRDRTTASGGLATVLQREPMTDFFEVVKVDSVPLADRRLIDNEGTASLVVPPGFQDSILNGGPVDLVYTPNPREVIRPPMVEAALSSFLEVGNRFLHESDTALDHMRGFRSLQGEPPRESIMTLAGEFYDASRRFEKMGRLRDLELKVERPAPQPGKKLGGSGNFNFFAFFLPGLTLMSALMVAQAFERRYARNRLAGMARRVTASPVRPLTVLAAEAAGILLVVLAASILILLFGAVLFRIPMRQPGLMALALLGYALFAVGLLKTIYVGAKSLRAAEAVGSVVIMLSMMLGGAFAPVEIYADSMRRFALMSPVGCASSAMVNGLVHGKSLAESAPQLLGIWAWAAVLCITGFALSRRAHARA